MKNKDRLVIDGSNSSMISYAEYFESRRELRVKFKNGGAIVVYNKVPIKVYNALKNAVNKGLSLGMTFWDEVRLYDRPNFIRSGSKFGYNYERGNG